MKKPNYTHRDSAGIRWRFEGSRPVSELADKTMADVLRDEKRRSKQARPGSKASRRR